MKVDTDRILSITAIIVAAGSLIAVSYQAYLMRKAQHASVLLKSMLHLFNLADVPDSWYSDADTTRKDKATIEVTFSSVYGDRWHIRSDRIVPER